ncbi:MAG: hypothetical protein EA397_19915 [Deltaproteobacteria bacterium]|nr:MAG: hypothetical protein EA397_19915 [Deltaproteobacteria bacterium]
MILHACRLALRPRGPLESFDLSFVLLRAVWRDVIGLSAVFLLPMLGAFLGLSWALSWPLWVAIFPLLLAPLLQAPFTVLLGRLLFSPSIPLREVALGTGQGAGGVLFAWVLTDLSVILCGGLGLFAQPFLVFLPEILLLERLSLGQAMTRVSALVSARPLSSLAGVVARWGLTVWGALAGEALGVAILGFVLQLGTPFGTLAEGVFTPFGLLGMLAVQPLIAAYRLLLYVDVRTRLEGWDLQVAFRALRLGGEG